MEHTYADDPLLVYPKSCNLITRSAIHAGQDGTVAEYNLDKLSTAHGFQVSSIHPLAGLEGQLAGPTPTALAFAPPLPYFVHSSADTLLLVADSAHKLRLYNADAHMCVATAVGPLHGGPITSCRVFRWACLLPNHQQT